MSQQFSITEAIQDMDGGVFEQRVSRAIRDAAAALMALDDGKKTSKVSVEFNLKRIAESSQVHVAHKVAYAIPTAKGKKTEEHTTNTPFYVSRDGGIWIMPPEQIGLNLQTQPTTAESK